MGYRLCLMLCLLVCSFTGHSQSKILNGAAAKNVVSGSQQMRVANPKEAPRFIRFDAGMAQNKFSMSDWKQQLGLPQASELRREPTVPGNNLREKEVLQQYHIGYPVEGAVYYLHYNNKREIIAANGQLWRDLPATATVGVSEAAALEQAQKSNHFQGATSFRPSNEPILVFAPVRNKRGEILEHRLCYKIDVYSTSPLRRAWVYVDAASGKEVYSINRIHETNATGTAHTRYSGQQQISTTAEGGQYLLRDYSRGNGIFTRNANSSYDYSSSTDFQDEDNVWNTTTNYDNAAYDAHWGAIKTVDYFRETFNRNSFDNNGATVNLYVHIGNMYNNAFWDGENLAFGDGSNSYGGFTPLTSIDVVAHEFTHAVTTHSASLIYAYESGALNESFSDIFGAVVEHYAKPEVANYLVGEEITVGGGALRSMIRPNDYQHPDTYGGDYYYTGSEDNGGVHYNSGVQNYWFYLLAQGGSGTNDHGNTFTVDGIGITKAAAIAYRNLTTYLTPNASFEDAAFYAILSAEDLYGACSAEAQATAQAWYAVGVIEQPSFVTTADFSASQTYSCSIENSITFNNLSQWSESYLWDFGDGTTSTETNPVHRYNTPGTYTVTLTAYPSGTCGTETDILSRTAYITIEEGEQPTAATCTPTLQVTCCEVGITRVVLSNLDMPTTDWERGYNDYTCQLAIQLTQGSSADFLFYTRYIEGEKLQASIDWNNNGIFENSEQFYNSNTSMLRLHSGSLTVPTTAQLNQPLRMRIRSSALYSATMNYCDDIEYGEVQDYTVMVQPNTNPPVADFVTSGTHIPGGHITFQDNSQHVPTSWNWTFQGASVATSQAQNPVVSFAQTGTYQVTLTVNNAFGSHTVSKNITINSEQVLCRDTQSANTSGVLYDSGGKDGSYRNGERCYYSYSGCGPINININILGIERCCDRLIIYDGPNNTGKELFHSQNVYNGNHTVTALSGSFYVSFTTDGSVVGQGFEISWTQPATDSNPPVASFEIEDENPPLNTPVAFANNSTNSFYHLWSFGDGTVSTDNSPIHTYQEPGTYQVVLETSNCQGSTSISKTLTVQQSPSASIDHQVKTIRLRRNDSYQLPISISNTGEGDLAWRYVTDATENVVTIWRLDTDYNYSIGYILGNGNNELKDYYGEYYGSSLKDLLAVSNVLVLPYYYGNLQDLRNVKGDIQDFVENGGTLIMTGQPDYAINELGYFTSTGYRTSSYDQLNKTSTSHPLLANISGHIYAEYNTYSHTFSNTEEFQEVLTSQGQTTVAVKPVKNGQVIYLGFDYYYSNYNLQYLLMNAASVYTYPSVYWIQMQEEAGRIDANTTERISATIHTSGLALGEYRGGARLWTNDINNKLINNRINLIVTDQTYENFSWTRSNSCSGTVSFNNESTLSDTRTFNWDFGDGATSSEIFPEHTYSMPGTYAVKLTVRDDNTGTRNVSKNVVADFLAARLEVADSAHIHYPLEFKAEIGSTTATTIHWEFGDGYSAMVANPKHTYEVAGKYTVRLTLRNNSGCETIYEKPIVVGYFPALALEELPMHALSVYPNPSRGELKLKAPIGIWEATVSDQQGKKLLTRTVQSLGSEHELDISALPKGLYILHIKNHQQEAYRKIIIY